MPPPPPSPRLRPVVARVAGLNLGCFGIELAVALGIAGLATAATRSPWPDLVAALGIAVINADSACDVLKAARREWRAAADEAASQARA
ncbi:MAG: hypothetical protein PGN25_20325 [Methylorubrum populi]